MRVSTSEQNLDAQPNAPKEAGAGGVGGRPPALSPAQKKKARRMRDEERRSLSEIAAIFGVSVKTVRRA